MVVDSEYLSIAIQYYVAGRSASFADSKPVAGNLFHHGVEMLLKSFLLDSYSASQLKSEFRHDLKKLWRAFKKVANEPALGGFDELVSKLNKVKDVRYPKKGYIFSISLDKGQRPRASGKATKGLRQYIVNLEEMDEFFTVVLKGRTTSGWVRNLLLKNDAKAQYRRENKHPFF